MLINDVYATNSWYAKYANSFGVETGIKPSINPNRNPMIYLDKPT